MNFSRIVFVAGVQAPVSTQLDQYSRHLLADKCYVAEIGENVERVVAGPFDTEAQAEDARLLEERIDLAASQEHLQGAKPSSLFLWKEGYRRAWNGEDISTFPSSAVAAAFDQGYKAGSIERFSYDGSPTGISERARIGPAARRAFDSFIGVEKYGAINGRR